jgi:sterol desaturase/sphingolipid hydroxylase (fatty acid hydroxylase superfamily)
MDYDSVMMVTSPFIIVASTWLYALQLERLYKIGSEWSSSQLKLDQVQKIRLEVLKNQIIQGIVYTFAAWLDLGQTYTSTIPSWIRFFFAMVILDTWQYCLHRAMHEFRWLYAKIHSVHHAMIDPFASGTFYNHLAEGFIMDAVGIFIAQKLASLTPTMMLIFCLFASLKTTHDHLGSEFQIWEKSKEAVTWKSYLYDPMRLWNLVSDNDPLYHQIHHQTTGRKFNFQQPFFTFLDTLLNTRSSSCTDKNLRHSLALKHRKYISLD